MRNEAIFMSTKKIISITVILILICVISYLLFNLYGSYNYKKKLENTLKFLEIHKTAQWHLAEDKMTREEFEKNNLAAIIYNNMYYYIKNNPQKINIPQITSAYLNSEELNLYWLEDGFEIKGIKFAQIKGNERKSFPLSIFETSKYWDEKTKKGYENSLYRNCLIHISFGETFELKSKPDDFIKYVIVVPKDITENTTLISLYTSDGKEGRTIPLLIPDEVKKKIKESKY